MTSGPDELQRFVVLPGAPGSGQQRSGWVTAPPAASGAERRVRSDGGDKSHGYGLDLLARTDYAETSIFLPQHLLREARRQRALPAGSVPSICVLDPDGDIVHHLERTGRAVRSPSWACYHTDLVESEIEGLRVGIVGGAVGAPFAVLVAEELFASGCDLLIGVTSAGAIASDLTLPCIILIDRALRGEGTSHAYLPPELAVEADPGLIGAVARGLMVAGIDVRRGTTWTTDAPFRETPTALAAAAAAGALAVEMEAAALYAFAAARRHPVICFAHITNAMGVRDMDFEKGPANGAEEAINVIVAATHGWVDAQTSSKGGVHMSE